MFTGIIEEQGTVKRIEKTDEQSVTLTISAATILEDVKTGDSIAVNGICLTVTRFTSEDFQVDVMPETVKATSLNRLHAGSGVNLERAMQVNDRFGGHFISGHVDGIGAITKKEKEENAVYYNIKAEKNASALLMKKGSIAVDGISLTVFDVQEETFTVSLIPHTTAVTTLGNKKMGDIVNLEYDMLGKYVRNILDHQTVKSAGY
ncbi:riboflavin synthase [Virgibacillus sp. YIM 98842]|uniref:riboflavin synthase n=1 Tax=Virgibacillus sp. YIM 98842 TaxID=2663533 RepID=UPI0013DCC170|nr:riboflavin synthase [Virgibacillus sp. YIM 98842]